MCHGTDHHSIVTWRCLAEIEKTTSIWLSAFASCWGVGGEPLSSVFFCLWMNPFLGVNHSWRSMIFIMLNHVKPHHGNQHTLSFDSPVSSHHAGSQSCLLALDPLFHLYEGICDLTCAWCNLGCRKFLRRRMPETSGIVFKMPAAANVWLIVWYHLFIISCNSMRAKKKRAKECTRGLYKTFENVAKCGKHLISQVAWGHEESYLDWSTHSPWHAQLLCPRVSA